MPRTERPRMASYGVPADLDGVLPWEWAEERLLRNRNYWVTTVDPQGRPHTMPVWGVWRLHDEAFWFSCAPDSLRARNLATRPHVTVAGNDTVEVVSLEGEATAVEDRAEIADFASEYAAKYEPDTQKRAQMEEFVASHAVFRVRPTKALGIIEREADFARCATRWVW